MVNEAERSGVSLHEAKVYLALKGKPGMWMTNKDVSAASGVAERTARMHTLRLVKLGVIEVAQVFPGNRYRWTDKPQRKPTYLKKLTDAIAVFGLETKQ